MEFEFWLWFNESWGLIDEVSAFANFPEEFFDLCETNEFVKSDFCIIILIVFCV